MGYCTGTGTWRYNVGTLAGCPFSVSRTDSWGAVKPLFRVFGILGVMLTLSFGLTNLGLMIAWRMDSTQGFHAIMNLILIPVWLLSGAFFPVSGVPILLEWVMKLNPLTYGVAALRRCLYFNAPIIL